MATIQIKKPDETFFILLVSPSPIEELKKINHTIYKEKNASIVADLLIQKNNLKIKRTSLTKYIHECFIHNGTLYFYWKRWKQWSRIKNFKEGKDVPVTFGDFESFGEFKIL